MPQPITAATRATHGSGSSNNQCVRVGFENRNHAYKRTWPIRGGNLVGDGEGVVYIGDGAWCVGTRETHDAAATWYLQRAEKVHHLILVTLEGPRLHAEVIDKNGTVIDEHRTP